MKLNKNKSIPIMMSAVIALIAGVATTPAAFAHTDRYWAGFHDGAHDAYADYGVRYFNASCNPDEGPNYCAGYSDGYHQEWWQLGKYYNTPEKIQNKIGSNKQTIGQSSEVNIKGNNNRVVVTQQANEGAQQPISGYPVYSNDGSSGHSSSRDGSQSNPECIILCANVRIN